MKNHQKGSVLIMILIILIIGTGAYFYLTTVVDTTNGATHVKIALLTVPGINNDGPNLRGCDQVILSDRKITPRTKDPLTAAMKELFKKDQSWPYSDGRPGNFISSQKNLFFDHATIEDGVANIYLTGSYTLGGECDDPRTETQIVETAKQFYMVHSVQIFLNGKEFVTPNEKG